MFVLFVAMLSFQVDDTSTSARELYRQAVEAINLDQPSVALKHLQLIVDHHADSEYAQPSVVYLSEHYIVSDQSILAVELLITWAAKAPPVSSAIGNERLHKLLVTALSRLSQVELEAVYRRVSSETFERSRHDNLTTARATVFRELARRSVQNGQPEIAMECLAKLGSQITAGEKELLVYQLPLAILRRASEAATVQRLQESITANAQLTISKRVCLNLSIAEAYRRLNEPNSALRILDKLSTELAEILQSVSPKVSQIATNKDDANVDTVDQPTDGQLTDWRAAVDLKRAELLLQMGKFREANSLLQNAIAEYPNFALRHELRFLLVRGLIADIEFEQAAKELNTIIAESQVTNEPKARAFWLLGEIELLKQQSANAIAFYEQAAAIDDQPQWQARSLVQLGRCMELKGSPLEAAGYYQQVVEQHAGADVFPLAVQRLAGIQHLISLPRDLTHSDRQKLERQAKQIPTNSHRQ